MSLSTFLMDSKHHYLKDVQEDKGQGWIVAMGNEAGDLDSVASSIAYSWFASTVQQNPCVALLQTRRDDLRLRPENIYAFSIISLSPSLEELLCIDDMLSSMSFPSNRFALVDHNRLLPRFSDKNERVEVVAILDHHDDEGLYRDSANPRTIIVPTGSASSIVARHIEQSSTEQILPEVARLLLCAILVDTSGLKPGGKAEELDHMAVSYLLPRSELDVVSTFTPHESLSIVSVLAKDLIAKKFNVGQLSTIDLLRRDYKQYAWTENGRAVLVGLSTVPIDFHIWLVRNSVEEFWREVDMFVNERKLNVLGILTTFQKEKSKHKRQLLLIIRDVPGGELERRLCMGVENASELALEPYAVSKFVSKLQKGKPHTDIPKDVGIGSRRVYLYKQVNTKATRKVIAPLMKQIIEGQAKVA
ncbi:DHH phosphoesterase [Fomitiporia mediterranea MF3/22]|uniref:DHH phosphoesterase n=1 Tax=Fomitiporia mediterranea (strain MF3/22) TaxID=694068 RepID=UPI0004408807|nr:DHH phosphoesterase [Fomitiporia mediterranea MF3/22]EJD05301.1 DHH phosphoesterase [Fomitiporia mediterranea MF3/22]